MKTPMRMLLPAAIALALTAAAAISFARGEESRTGDLAIVSAWARATPPGASVGAAYLTIENRGAADDRLVGAESPAARSITMHQTIEENGVSAMRPIENAPIFAGGRLEMAPAGGHLMLTGLAAPLKQGATIPMTLTFEKAGAVTIEVEIAPLGAAGPAQHDHAM